MPARFQAVHPSWSTETHVLFHPGHAQPAGRPPQHRLTGRVLVFRSRNVQHLTFSFYHVPGQSVLTEPEPMKLLVTPGAVWDAPSCLFVGMLAVRCGPACRVVWYRRTNDAVSRMPIGNCNTGSWRIRAALQSGPVIIGGVSCSLRLSFLLLFCPGTQAWLTGSVVLRLASKHDVAQPFLHIVKF
jgi:hypothetical protein